MSAVFRTLQCASVTAAWRCRKDIGSNSQHEFHQVTPNFLTLMFAARWSENLKFILFRPGEIVMWAGSEQKHATALITVGAAVRAPTQTFQGGGDKKKKKKTENSSFHVHLEAAPVGPVGGPRTPLWKPSCHSLQLTALKVEGKRISRCVGASDAGSTLKLAA